jgi:DNA-binding transcriptional MerR regulator
VSATTGMLKMSELADRSGVSAGTIKHYLREGLLGGEDEVVRTSRNMAYYPEAFVDRVRLIKRLQETRYMPLKRIREALERDDAERLAALADLEDSILERAAGVGQEGPYLTRAQLLERHPLPANVLDRLEAIGVLTPDREGYAADDVAIVEAMVAFRAGGFEESLGFTVYDTLRYRDALAPLVEEEVRVLLERLAGEVEVERAVGIIAAGRAPLRDLVGAMHAKLLRAELDCQRPRGPISDRPP